MLFGPLSLGSLERLTPCEVNSVLWVHNMTNQHMNLHLYLSYRNVNVMFQFTHAVL